MAVNDEAVRVAVTGAVYCAPVGTTLPTTIAASLNAAFEEVGYISADAITEGLDVSSETLPMWQAPSGVRTVTTEVGWTFQFSMGESTALTHELYYMGAASTTAGGVTTTTVLKSPTTVSKAWVIELEDGDVTTRIVIPKADVTDRGEVARKGTEGTYFDVTIKAMGTNIAALGYLITNDPEMAISAS